MSESKREAAHTPGPWFVGAQNDALYILDRRPAHDNDYPDHEADVGCIAKVYDDIRDAKIGRANAALIARAPDLAAEVDGLKFDARGEPRTRYVRVSLDGNHCVMHPSEGDRYVEDARQAGDESPYVVRDVWLSEREFDDLPEHEGF